MLAEVLTALVCAAGCGRVGFESPLATDDAGADPDADSAPACTPTAEQCNGIDDDCNGIIDDGCSCAPFDLSLGVASAFYPGMVWTGAGYLLLTEDGSSYGLQEVTPSGALGARTAVRPTAGAMPFGSRPLAWDGTAASVVWQSDTKQIMVSRFDAHATPLGAPIEVSPSTAGFEPTILAQRAGTLVAWADSRGGSPVTYLQQLATDGTPRGAEVPTIAGGVGTIAATRTGYVMVVYPDDSQSATQVVSIAADGTQRAEHVIAGTTVSSGTALAFGSQLAVTWRVNSDFDCQLEALADDGTPDGTIVTSPIYNTHTMLLDAVAGTPTGYTVFGLTIGGQPEVVRADYDRSFNLLAGPTLLYTFDGNGFDDLQALATDHRQAVLVPTQAPSQVRLVQQCR